MWRLQVHQGSGPEASRPDWPAEGDRIGAAEEERLCGHPPADKGRREEEIRRKELGGDKSTLSDWRLSPPRQDEDGRGLTDEEVQAEANTFMFAGEAAIWANADGVLLRTNKQTNKRVAAFSPQVTTRRPAPSAGRCTT